MGSKHIVKKCGDCQKIKSVGEFYKDRRGTLYRDGYCKQCRRRRDRKRTRAGNTFYARRKEEDPLFFRKRKLKKLYGITHKRWKRMYKRQGGVCAICRGKEASVLYGKVSHLVVDHNHHTGKVRGLLCRQCNSKLGVVENEQFYLLAREYLANTDNYKFLKVEKCLRKRKSLTN